MGQPPSLIDPIWNHFGQCLLVEGQDSSFRILGKRVQPGT
jgi:hypothetical protein